MLRPALVIALKDLRQRVRDRSAFTMGVVGPLALVFILDLSLGGIGEVSGFRMALVNHDRGDLGVAFDELFDGLVADGLIDGSRLEDRDELDRRVADGELDAGFVIGSGFSREVGSGSGGTITVVGDPGSSIAVAVAQAIASGFGAEADYLGVVTGAVAASGGGPLDAADVATRAAAEPRPVVLGDAATGGRGYDVSSYYAVSMSVYFLFFTVQFGVLSLLAEREDGTLARLLVAPIRPSTVLLGKVAASVVFGVVAMVVLIVSTTVLVGAEWGAVVPVALLVLVGVLVATSLSLVVGGVARTAEQAGAFSSLLAVVLGLLGGAFFPVSEGPGALSLLSYLSPQRWLLDGFRDVSYGADVGDLAASLGVSLGFVVVAGGVGLVASGRRLVSS